MKPIEIKIFGLTQKSASEICLEIVDTERWVEFKGYFILPGIKQAYFETKMPGWVGSRIKVHNTNGSSHVEEILVWEPERQVALKFQEFEAPLKHLATQFVETWSFRKSAQGMEITRAMSMYPKGLLGWLLLLPISLLMKKAFEKNASRLSSE